MGSAWPLTCLHVPHSHQDPDPTSQEEADLLCVQHLLDGHESLEEGGEGEADPLEPPRGGGTAGRPRRDPALQSRGGSGGRATQPPGASGCSSVKWGHAPSSRLSSRAALPPSSGFSRRHAAWESWGASRAPGGLWAGGGPGRLLGGRRPGRGGQGRASWPGQWGEPAPEGGRPRGRSSGSWGGGQGGQLVCHFPRGSCSSGGKLAAVWALGRVQGPRGRRPLMDSSPRRSHLSGSACSGVKPGLREVSLEVLRGLSLPRGVRDA